MKLLLDVDQSTRGSIPLSSQPRKLHYKLSQATDKVVNMTSSTCNTTTSLDSDSESLFSQDYSSFDTDDMGAIPLYVLSMLFRLVHCDTHDM